MKKWIVAVGLAGMLVPGLAFSAQIFEKVGTFDGQFLKIGVGARAERLVQLGLVKDRINGCRSADRARIGPGPLKARLVRDAADGGVARVVVDVDQVHVRLHRAAEEEIRRGVRAL